MARSPCVSTCGRPRSACRRAMMRTSLLGVIRVTFSMWMASRFGPAGSVRTIQVWKMDPPRAGCGSGHVDSDGVWLPSVECGHTASYSRRQFSISTLASTRLWNHCITRHSAWNLQFSECFEPLRAARHARMGLSHHAPTEPLNPRSLTNDERDD